MSDYITNDNGTDRPMTPAEVQAHEIVKADLEKRTKARAKAEADKATAKQAVLDKLGLTADEVTALLG
jgi:hypothetical protein